MGCGMEILVYTFLAITLLLFFIFILLSRSFFGLWLTEVGLLISALPIAIIITSIIFISKNFNLINERINVLFLSICLILNLVVLLRVFIPFFYIRRTNLALQKYMVESLGKDYLQYIDPCITSEHIKNVRFQIRQYFIGIRRRIYSKRVHSEKNVVYKEIEGRKLTLNVYYPKKEGIFPTIIFIHGGAFLVGSKNQLKNERLSYMLADLGYTVFNIDYRLTPIKYLTSKKTNLKEELIICDMVVDIREAIIFAKKHTIKYKNNPMELFLFGRSAGGHLALLTTFSCLGCFYSVEEIVGDIEEHKILGVIAFYPVTDFTSLFEQYGRQNLIQYLMSRSVGGTPDDMKYYYQVLSPITYVTDKNRSAIPPTFLATGKKDRMVAPEQSRKLYQRLQALKITSVLLDLPWANHAFDNIVHGPGGQLVLKYLSQFLVWVITQNKLHLIEDMANKHGLGKIVSKEKNQIIQELRNYEIKDENDIKEFLAKIGKDYHKKD
ncbi:MAG: alpha/beta hydrolase [Asgard group archaeon]|nr:alpha/beta hydrolase [Asgard group archaeon]